MPGLCRILTSRAPPAADFPNPDGEPQWPFPFDLPSRTPTASLGELAGGWPRLHGFVSFTTKWVPHPFAEAGLCYFSFWERVGIDILRTTTISIAIRHPRHHCTRARPSPCLLGIDEPGETNQMLIFSLHRWENPPPWIHRGRIRDALPAKMKRRQAQREVSPARSRGAFDALRGKCWVTEEKDPSLRRRPRAA